MNKHDQIKAIAELDGWTDVNWYDGDNSGPGYWNGYPETKVGVSEAMEWEAQKEKYHKPLPHYLTSYDAIIPVIQKLGKMDGISFVGYLMVTEFGSNFEIDESAAFKLITCTPAQLAEALLRATGKWITTKHT